MKLIFGAVALASLAACDDGGVIDKTVHQGVRQSAVEACAAWIPQSNVAAAAGLDGQRLCACAVDRVMEDKNISELPELRPNSAEVRAALVQCVGQIQATQREAQPS